MWTAASAQGWKPYPSDDVWLAASPLLEGLHHLILIPEVCYPPALLVLLIVVHSLIQQRGNLHFRAMNEG